MKVLITIPHYFYAQSEQARFNSLRPSSKPQRIRILEEVIDRLQLYWGGKVYGAIHSQKRFEPLDDGCELDIRIVTVKDRHLLGELKIPETSYRHVEVEGDPLQLGFHCHRILQENQGNYDVYGYLEDDIIVEDAYLLHKIRYLTQSAEAGGLTDVLFQPQRFESALGLGVRQKELYNAILMDWRIAPDNDETPLAVDWFGQRICFERTTLPHAGCFFLNERQLAQLSGKENFGRLDRTWVTPLDTAATFAIGTNFRVYKPVLRDFHFLAVRHGGEVISAKLAEGQLSVEADRPTGWLS